MKGGDTKRYTARHIARLILIGLYTGTRPGAILDLYWQPNVMGGWIDLEAGVLHRRAEAKPSPGRGSHRSSSRAVCKQAHLRRWKRIDDALPPPTNEAGNVLPRPVIYWHGKAVEKMKAFPKIVEAAGLSTTCRLTFSATREPRGLCRPAWISGRRPGRSA
jgi:hypothetical protein